MIEVVKKIYTTIADWCMVVIAELVLLALPDEDRIRARHAEIEETLGV